MITIVGMGSKRGDLTLDGLSAIQQADVVVVKSQLTHAGQTVAEIRSDAIYCDDLFEQAEDFDHLNQLIVERLGSFGRKKVVFCVVGDGKDDSTVEHVKTAHVVNGVGLQSCVATSMDSLVLYTATELLQTRRLVVQPTVVKYIDDVYVASEVQLKLSSCFDVDNPLVYFDGNKTKVITLGDLQKQKFNYQSTLFITPLPLEERKVFDYNDAIAVLNRLRQPDGCPWDREQTHRSISKNVIEEAYELANALENEDINNIVEELGDLLMQVIFHLEIASDEGEFAPESVYTALCRKLIDRHPHVFGDVVATTQEESLDVWNKQKQKEHKIKNVAENVLDVPRSMSALMRCQKVQSRASKGGYDFANLDQVVQKVKEELQEFLSATPDQKQMEGGDLLFAVVNLLRLSNIDSEIALCTSTEKFCRRVVECQRILDERNQTLLQLSGQEFDEIWNEAKKNGY